MHRFLWLGGLLAALTLVYVGCDASSDDTRSGKGTTEAIRTAQPSGFAFPDGTAFSDRTENGSLVLDFRLPPGFALLVRGQDGATSNLDNGTVRCRCVRGSGGCNPFKATVDGQTFVGCHLDGCTECVASVTRTGGGTVDEAYPLGESLVLDRRAPIGVVRTLEQMQGRSCASGLLLEDPEIVREIAAFVAPLMGSDPEGVRRASADPTTDVLRVPLDVYGHLLWVPVSAEWQDMTHDVATDDLSSDLVWDRYFRLETDDAQANRDEGGGGSCRCESGGGGCTYHRRGNRLLGVIEWCEASQCSTCVLNS